MSDVPRETNLPDALIVQLGPPSELEQQLWGDDASEQRAIKVARVVQEALLDEGLRDVAVAFRSNSARHVVVKALNSRAEDRIVSLNRMFAQDEVTQMTHPEDLVHVKGVYVRLGDIAAALTVDVPRET